MGGLIHSIDLAMSGLRATQAGMEVVSQNVANSGTVGYTRRVIDLEQRVAGGRTIGVDVVGTNRVLDAAIQRQLRLEQAGASYTATKLSAHRALDGMFDRPGGTGTLPSLLTTFTTRLQALANSPSSATNRSAVLSAASDLALTLNGVAGQVGDLRQSTENAIGTAVGEADGLLQSIAAVDARITANPGSAALLDQRDALLDRLSELMDVKVSPQSNGSVLVSTTGGLSLYDGRTATRLSFDAHSPLGPEATYSADAAERGVGTITATDGAGITRDVLASGLIRSGSIAANVDLRDRVLVQAQMQLDELAAGLASALSDKPVPGTPATAGAATGFDIDLASLSAGNSFSVSIAGPGGPRTLTFVKAASQAGAAAASSDGRIGVDVSGGMASIASQVAAALGPGYAASSPGGTVLRVLDDGAAGTTDVTGLSGAATIAGLASGGPELPLFVDGGRANAVFTGTYEAGSQRTGFASRIVVNPAVVSDPGALVVYGAGVAAGDPARPTAIIDRLTGTARTFSAAAAIGGSDAPFSGTVADFARRIVESQAADTASATTLDDGQQVVLNTLKGRYAEDAGVNIDSELAQLIQLQTAYGANARVLTAANDMLTLLLRIGT